MLAMCSYKLCDVTQLLSILLTIVLLLTIDFSFDFTHTENCCLHCLDSARHPHALFLRNDFPEMFSVAFILYLYKQKPPRVVVDRRSGQSRSCLISFVMRLSFARS